MTDDKDGFDSATGKAFGVAAPRALRTAHGQRYAEWRLLLDDLEQCREIVRLTEKIVAPLDEQHRTWVKISLFRDLVVRFIACFDEDSPVCLDPDTLYAHIDGALDSFRWIENIRHTSIAHRHGASRQASTSVYLNEETGEILGIGGFTSGISWRIEEAAFAALIEIAMVHVQDQVERLHKVVAEELKAMYPSQRLRLPLAAVKVPDERTIRLGRSKFANINRMNRSDVQMPKEVDNPDELLGDS